MFLAFFPLIYFAVIVAIGLSQRRAIATQSDFFLARKSANAWLVTGSLLATSLGAFGVMGVSGKASQIGLVAGWYIWSGVAGYLFLGAWAYKRLEVRDVFTLPELLGRAYGLQMRRISAMLITIAWIAIISAQLIAAGKILHFLGIQTGYWGGSSWGDIPSIVLVSFFFIAYTGLGGQHSVLRTDLFQAIIIILALLILIASIMNNHPDALQGTGGEMLRMPFNENMPFSKWAVLMLTFGVPFLVGPDIYSRLFSGRDELTARRAVMAAGVLMIPVFFLVAFAGVLGAALVPHIKDPDLVLLTLSAEKLAPLWLGLMVSGLLAAIMSSADTTLLTVSTLVTRDLIGTVHSSGDRQVVAQGRWAVVAAGLVSLGIALWLQDIVKALMWCYTLYSPSVLMPFLFLLFFPRHKFEPASGIAALLCGALFAAASMIYKMPELLYAAYILPALPLGISLLLVQWRGK